MKTIEVCVVKSATVQVCVEDARRNLAERGITDIMTDEDVVETYISYAEGDELDLCFDRDIYAMQRVK